jgi:Na+-driven multidrug efflux pump
MIFTHTKAKRFTFVKGVYSSLKIPADLSKRIIRSGFPLLINEFLWSLSQAMLLQCYSVRGLGVVAASNIAGTAANLFNVAFISMGGALSIMLGQALGAKNNEKAKDMVWKLISLSVFLSFVMGTFLALLSKAFPQMYNTEDEVRHIATYFLLILAVIMPVNAFSHCCYFIMRSGGRTIITFLFDSVIMWGVNIPVAFVLSNHTSLGIIMVYLIVQSLDILKCILGFILVKKGIWIRNIVN